MKLFNKIAIVVAAVLAFGACQKYELNTDFTVPTELNNPASVTLDVTSTKTVVLSWEGGAAADGGIVLYEVLFDKANGDFSKPFDVRKSDLGALPKLTLTHSDLNKIARKAGVKAEETGELKWTVRASKGGVVKESGLVGKIKVTRPAGIEIPTELFLCGAGAEDAAGVSFRCIEEGLFQIYTTIKAGDIALKSSKGADATNYYVSEEGKLVDGDGKFTVPASENVVRITVDCNTQKVTVDQIGKDVRCIWGATFNDIAVCSYVGNGKFVGEGDIIFIDQSRPNTNPPSWLGWTEERYYFIAKVNGGDMCWGRHDSVSAERPVGGEPASFYALYEFGWSQWDHLWKMSGNLDMKHATITIDTNADNLMIHTFTNVRAI